MCLYIGLKTRIKIAKKDIPCIKLVIKVGDEYYTPYQSMQVHPEEIVKSIISTKIQEWMIRRAVYHGIHSFVLEAHHEIVYDYNYHVREGRDVIELQCIIPKGAKYYLGNYGGKNDGYVSDTLIYPNNFESCVQ